MRSWDALRLLPIEEAAEKAAASELPAREGAATIPV